MSAARLRYDDGQKDDVAGVLCATYPYASRHLEQAPVLALAARRKSGSHVSFDERFAGLVAASPKLRDVLGSFDLPLAFRKVGLVAVKLA